MLLICCGDIMGSWRLLTPQTSGNSGRHSPGCVVQQPWGCTRPWTMIRTGPEDDSVGTAVMLFALMGPWCPLQSGSGQGKHRGNCVPGAQLGAQVLDHAASVDLADLTSKVGQRFRPQGPVGGSSVTTGMADAHTCTATTCSPAVPHVPGPCGWQPSPSTPRASCWESGNKV